MNKINSVIKYYRLVRVQLKNEHITICNEINRTSVFNKTRLLYLFNNKNGLESKLHTLELNLKEMD
jgi:hypothetical protein